MLNNDISFIGKYFTKYFVISFIGGIVLLLMGQLSYADGEPGLPPVPANPAEILKNQHSWFITFAEVYDRFSGDLINTHLIPTKPITSTNTLDMSMTVADLSYILNSKWSMDVSIPYMYLNLNSTLPSPIPAIHVKVHGIGDPYLGGTYGIFRNKEQNLSFSMGGIFRIGDVATERYLGVWGKARFIYRGEFSITQIIPQIVNKNWVVGTEDYLEARLYKDSSFSLKPMLYANVWGGYSFYKHVTLYAKLQEENWFTFIGKSAQVNPHLRHTTAENKGILSGYLGVRTRLTGLKIPNESLQIEVGFPLVQTKLNDQLKTDFVVDAVWAIAF